MPKIKHFNYCAKNTVGPVLLILSPYCVTAGRPCTPVSSRVLSQQLITKLLFCCLSCKNTISTLDYFKYFSVDFFLSNKMEKLKEKGELSN